MPYYDYQCPDCGPFDQRRPLSESALPASCPACGKASPRKLSAPHVGGSTREPRGFGGGSAGGGGCGNGGCGHVH
jgi:putative FmdB family regulatory protein